jgi:hypothetical protein
MHVFPAARTLRAPHVLRTPRSLLFALLAAALPPAVSGVDVPLAPGFTYQGLLE